MIFKDTDKIGEKMKIFDLSDELLIRTYKQAKKLKLDEEFIHMLMKEIERRNLSIENETQ